MTLPLKAVMVAGSSGTRISEVTGVRPKPIVVHERELHVPRVRGRTS